MVEPSQKGSSSLSKSVDKAELVSRSVAHAAAAAEYFPSNDLDDDDKEYDRQEEREEKKRKKVPNRTVEKWQSPAKRVVPV